MPLDGLPSQQPDSAQQAVHIWQRIDPRKVRLIRDKLLLASQQLRKDIDKASAKIRFANRLNLNKNGVEMTVAQMWMQKVDDYAGRCYEILCHHWNLLGESKTGAFVRVVLDILVARIEHFGGGAAHAASMAHRRRGSIGTSPAGLYETSARAICDHWRTKLDIEARELDLAASIERAQKRTKPAMPRPENSRNPPAVTFPLDPVAILKPGEIVAECEPLSSEATGTTGAAVEILQRLGFGAEGQGWPSPAFGPALPGVMGELKRAHRILTARGFLVVGDPLNPLGDGRSWVLRFEPTNKLPNDADPADLAHQYLESEGVKVATRPVQDDQTLLVALWDSGQVDATPAKNKRTANEVLVKRRNHSRSGSRQRPKDTVPAHTGKNKSRRRPKSDGLLSSYRSEIKRAILAQLALNPKATDVEICRGLDADGSVELPPSWKSKLSDRGFFDAYSDAVRRHKVEVTISKVRKDLRRHGLLD